MAYYEERVDVLKESTQEDFNFPVATIVPALWEFFTQVRYSVFEERNISLGSFMYYERPISSKRILGFRMPDTDSYIIYVCTVKNKNGKDNYRVAVAGIKGEESMAYFKATAKLIIPFFKKIEQEVARDDFHSTAVTIDMRSGKFKKKVTPVYLNENVDREPEDKIASKHK